MSSADWEDDASTYAARLLQPWPALDALRPDAGADRHPALAWAASGAMALTGVVGRPALAPGALAACARGALAALRAVAAGGPVQATDSRDAPTPEGVSAADRATDLHLDLDAAALLGERAAIFGLTRAGRTSPGGSCRLLPASDGWIALNLARPEDRELIPAWLGEAPEPESDALAGVARCIEKRAVAEVVERGRLMGLPVAPVVAPASVPPWLRVESTGSSVSRLGEPTASPAAGRSLQHEGPLVVDLSSLWAGPLCTHLLGLCGARVVKVESLERPDGARDGPSAFFDLMNGGKRSVALALGTPAGRDVLRALLEAADIIVESARPRALEQMGIFAADILDRCAGKTWLGITGYGRRAPMRDWVAFGDDAAAAAGLPLRTGGPAETPIFCGDAIADPLTGLHGAVAALASWLSGGGELLDVSLRDVTAHTLGFRDDAPGARVVASDAGWVVEVADESTAIAPPRARRSTTPARALGTDTNEVLTEVGIQC